MKGLSIAAEGVGQIISGDFFDGLVNAVDGVSQSFSGLADMINDIFTGRNMEAEYNNIELKAIRKAVDKIVEKFDNDTMAQAIDDYEAAMKSYTDELNKAQQNVQDAFSESSSSLAGRYNHHSINYYMNDFGGQAEFDAINQLLGTNVQGWGDLWFLSPDQLAEIERELPRIFAIIYKGIAEMSNNASASSDDEIAQEALEAYMELAGKKKEIDDAFNLKMTGATIDSVKSDFKGMLSDMTSDAEAFGEKVQDILLNSISNQLMSDKYSSELEGWYDLLREAYKNDGRLDEDEIRQLREKYQQIAEEALRDRDDLFKIIGEIDEREYFTNLRDMWLSTLTDMEADGEAWKREILRVMFEDLVNEFVLGNDFNTWLENWKKAYKEALDAGDEERLTQLLEEQVRKREELAGKAQDIAEGIGYDKLAEEAENAFKEIRSSLLDTLMDMDADAESWGKKIRETLLKEMVEKTIVESMGLGELMETYGAKLLGVITDESLTDAQRNQSIDEVLSEMEEAYGEASDLVQKMRDALGIGKKEEAAESPIKDLRDKFLSDLMDMTAGTRDSVNEINKLLTQKLVEKFVLNSAFDSWLEGMQSRYDAIFSSGMTEEQTAAAMNRLAAEWEAKAKEMQEQTQAIFDLTGWSSIVDQMNSPLTDLRSSFRSALMDMENDTEDFTNEISKLLTEAFIDRFVLGDEFDKRLAEWQEQYAAIMRGNYSEDERASLLKHLQQAITAAKEGYAEEAQAIHDLMGTGNAKDQTATMNMADKATYDQFETYLGIAVAQQMATLQGNEVREEILATLRGMRGITTPGGDTVKEIRSLLNTTNEYLLDIKRSNRAILEQFGMKIDNIIGKLTKLV